MPSGKAHLRMEAMMLILWIACAVVLVWKDQIALLHAGLFAGAYIFSMLLLSPDLDLAKSDAFHRWGILRWLWLPYAWVFRHRQMSHHLLWGPLTRMAYVGLAAVAIGALVRLGWRETTLGSQPPAASILAICLGVYLPNLEHILADRLTTTWRRKRRKHRL
ncbi:DUF2227 family putative metal-binding protein [Candidatus Bipolaricaulota bacterium]|nr:DUF2227 family putative metal-binding protein [Candidatus Bipolaricaulota bacterium]TFH11602.1 MAG: hydrolase [Candidatus Atribacteria bacterium]